MNLFMKSFDGQLNFAHVSLNSSSSVQCVLLPKMDRLTGRDVNVAIVCIVTSLIDGLGIR